MYVVLVTLDVHEDKIEPFLAAITENARSAVADEPGCLGFEVLRVTDPANRFVFYELYRDSAAFEEHNLQPHYLKWREAAAECVIQGSQVYVYADHLYSGAIAGSIGSNRPHS